ncbi:MAG TPA: amidophosphoribosyltransferase, partial [Brevundimonas sp.]|nr:amidophosphoribosyltransferase [Brevundimonas sp.]
MSHRLADPVIHHWPERESDDDQLRLECGVCGVWGAPGNEASSIVALGLHALQHRGQEACGIASVADTHFHTERHVGLVG